PARRLDAGPSAERFDLETRVLPQHPPVRRAERPAEARLGPGVLVERLALFRRGGVPGPQPARPAPEGVLQPPPPVPVARTEAQPSQRASSTSSSPATSFSVSARLARSRRASTSRRRPSRRTASTSPDFSTASMTLALEAPSASTTVMRADLWSG